MDSDQHELIRPHASDKSGVAHSLPTHDRSPGGRLRDLTVDPELIRSRDPESLVESITSAVNRAADELHAQLRASNDHPAGGAGADLDDVVAGLDRVFDQISADIARTRSSRG